MQLTVQGGGHAAKNNGVNGDLLVVIEEQAHPEFQSTPRAGHPLFVGFVRAAREHKANEGRAGGKLLKEASA